MKPALFIPIGIVVLLGIAGFLHQYKRAAILEAQVAGLAQDHDAMPGHGIEVQRDSETTQGSVQKCRVWLSESVTQGQRIERAHDGGLDKRTGAWTRPGQLISNGLFVLKEWMPQKEIVVEKSSTYWDRERVPVQPVPASDSVARSAVYREWMPFSRARCPSSRCTSKSSLICYIRLSPAGTRTGRIRTRGNSSRLEPTP